MARRRRRKTKKSISLSTMFGGLSSFFSFLFYKSAYLILAGVLLFLFMGMRNYCCSSDAFILNTINFTKTSYLTRDLLIKESGITFGENVFSLDIERASKQIEKMPRVKSAVIVRRLPDTLEFNIVERKEFAQIKVPMRNKFYLIDRDGMVLDPVLSEERDNLVTIETKFTNKSYLEPGKRFYSPAIEKAFQLIEVCSAENVLTNEKVSQISIDTGDNITLILSDGINIKLGANPSSCLKKLESLDDVLSGAMRESIEYIDLRFKDLIVRKK